MSRARFERLAKEWRVCARARGVVLPPRRRFHFALINVRKFPKITKLPGAFARFLLE